MNTNNISLSKNQNQKLVRQVHFLDTKYMRLLSSVNKELYDRIKKGLTDPSVSTAERFYWRIVLRKGIWGHGC